MNTKVLQQADQRTIAVIFSTGDEAMNGLLEAAKQYGLAGAHFTAIGGFSRATLGFFDWETKSYQKIPVDEQTEVVSLVGDVALEDGKPKVHAHAVLGRSDGLAWVGHLLEGYVPPTLEVIVTESPGHLQRKHDPESGLALIQL